LPFDTKITETFPNVELKDYTLNDEEHDHDHDDDDDRDHVDHDHDGVNTNVNGISSSSRIQMTYCVLMAASMLVMGI